MAFVGIDTDQFPGLAQLRALAQTNVAWVAYYLHAPSHSDSGWMGQRANIEAIGLACVPVYVGQQIVGPGSHKSGPIQGSIDGKDAAAKMSAEGFRPGQVCFLDLENGSPFASPQTDYVAAWCDGIEAGGYRPGVYCSHAIAEAVSKANPGALIWAFEVPTLEPSKAVAPFEEPDPAGSGFAAAAIWQHRDNVTIGGDGFHMLVDLDSSTQLNPAQGTAPRVVVVPPSPAPTPAPAPAPAAPPAADLVIPPPPMAVAPHPAPVAAVTQHAPAIAAGGAGVIAAGVTAVAGAHSVDLTYFIDTMWPLIVSGVIVPLMIWLIGRGLQYFHVQTQSALADEIRTVAMNGVYEATAAFQGYADAHPEVDVSNAVAARAAQYVVNAVPSKLARLGVSSTQLSSLVDAQLAKVKAPA